MNNNSGNSANSTASAMSGNSVYNKRSIYDRPSAYDRITEKMKSMSLISKTNSVNYRSAENSYKLNGKVAPYLPDRNFVVKKLRISIVTKTKLEEVEEYSESNLTEPSFIGTLIESKEQTERLLRERKQKRQEERNW